MNGFFFCFLKCVGSADTFQLLLANILPYYMYMRCESKGRSLFSIMPYADSSAAWPRRNVQMPYLKTSVIGGVPLALAATAAALLLFLSVGVVIVLADNVALG